MAYAIASSGVFNDTILRKESPARGLTPSNILDNTIRGTTLRDRLKYARRISEAMFVIQTGLGLWHLVYTVPPSTWSTLAIISSLSMHTAMMFNLGRSPARGSFEPHVFVPYFLVLGLLAWYYGSGWAMGLVSLVIRLVELEPNRR